MLVWYNFVDAERRHDTPGKEGKDFNTYDTADSMNFTFMKFFCLPGPILGYRVAQEDAVHAVVSHNGRNPNL